VTPPKSSAARPPDRPTQLPVLSRGRLVPTTVAVSSSQNAIDDTAGR
jgi:hypothetical protein